MAAFLAVAATMAVPVHAEFRYSSQTSLLLPDPFLKPAPKPKPTPVRPRVATAIKMPAEPNRKDLSIGDVRLAAFPGHMSVDAVARLTLDSETLKLVRQIELHFAQRAEIVSGCRGSRENLEARGANRSYHLSCQAADIRIPGVKPQEISVFALTLPGRGGVGTYCDSDVVHVDVGAKREWHRPCGAEALGGPDAGHFSMR
jgi:hypothetical protein